MALGEDFFDPSFFEEASIFESNVDINRIQYYGLQFDENELNDVLRENNLEKNYFDLILPNNKFKDFSSLALALPLTNESTKLYHYIEKILWLIQSYTIVGKWNNPVKLCNDKDIVNPLPLQPIYSCHPGGNRINAAKFLGCKTMHSLISVHNLQSRWAIENKNCLNKITTEEKLRKQLYSATSRIFVRTEGTVPLYINNVKTSMNWHDYTYEFVDGDAWPYRSLTSNYAERVQSEFEHWNDLLYHSFPLHVYNPNKVKFGQSIKGKTFFHKRKRLTKPITIVKTDKKPYGISIELHKPVKDLFALLFFMHPQYSKAKTSDNLVIIRNNDYPGHEDDRVLTIPESYDV